MTVEDTNDTSSKLVSIKTIVGILRQAEDANLLDDLISVPNIANAQLRVPIELPQAIASAIKSKNINPTEAFVACGCPSPIDNPFWPFPPDLA